MLEIFQDTTFILNDSIFIELSLSQLTDTIFFHFHNEAIPSNDTLFVKNVDEIESKFDLNILFTFLATVAALGSTFLSYRAIKISGQERSERTIGRINEGNHRYYDIIVLKPAIEIFSSYHKDSKKIFDTYSQFDISKKDIIKKIIDAWGLRHADFMLQLSSRLKNWVSTDLKTEEIDLILLEVEEHISEYLTIDSDNLDLNTLRRYLLQHINTKWSLILSLIKNSDPLFIDENEE